MNSSIAAYDLPDRVALYDADMEIMHPNRSKMVEIALEVLPFYSDSPIRALDLGVGTGFFTKRFIEKYPQSKVIAVDGAQSMVDLAKARLGGLSEKVDFRVGDFRHLTQLVAQDEKVNFVFSSYALHHLNYDEKLDVVQQALALLQPNGWFINADVIVAETVEIEKRIQEIRIDGIVRRNDGRDDRFRSIETTRKFLDELETNEIDQPLTLSEDLQLVEKAGLRNVSVFWSEYREAVYGGLK